MAPTVVQGIDVSRHQGSVDFRAVMQSGMRFAYVKATEGRDYIDPLFVDNWQKLQELDGQFGRGAYMFARPDTVGGAADGRAEASDFCDALEAVGGYVRGAGPPVMDYEKYSGKGTNANLAYIAAGVEELQDRLNRDPMIYTGKNVWSYQTEDSGRWVHLPLWLVEYSTAQLPRTLADMPWESYALWQWSGGGDYAYAKPVPGAGQVDVNRLGAGVDFEAFFEMGGSVNPAPDLTKLAALLEKAERLQGDAMLTIRAARRLLEA